MLDNIFVFLRCKITFFQNNKQTLYVKNFLKNRKTNIKIDKNEGELFTNSLNFTIVQFLICIFAQDLIRGQFFVYHLIF